MDFCRPHPHIWSRDNSQTYFHHLGYGEAFSTIEMELGFAYDMLYTKAYVVYTFIGAFIRLTSVLLVLMVLVDFCFLCDTKSLLRHCYCHHIHINFHSINDGNLCGCTLLRSDWTDHWLSQHNYPRNMLIFPFLKKPTKRRWSGSIAELNLISVALEAKPTSLFMKVNSDPIDKSSVVPWYD